MRRECIITVLIIDDDPDFVNRIREKVGPGVVLEHKNSVGNVNHSHDFYILGNSKNVIQSIETIREADKGGEILLFESACEKDVSLKRSLHWNLSGCIDKNVETLSKLLQNSYKTRTKMHEASSKLDLLKAGDLQILTRQLKKAESEKFVDFIQNHPLPMVLVDCEYDVLYANKALEKMIGTKLSGAPASMYWADPDKLDKVACDLKKEGQLLGREVTLKNIHGELLQMKLYTSIHCDSSGNWINTRCLFVPIDQLPPE